MAKKKYRLVVIKLGLVLYGLMIILLAYAFSRACLDADSFLGKLTSTTLGRITFGFALCVPFAVVDKILNKYGFITYKREELSEV